MMLAKFFFGEKKKAEQYATMAKKPVKKLEKGTRMHFLSKKLKATLGVARLRQTVLLPEGEDLNEWLALHTVDFYNAISLLQASLQDVCTVESCPRMTGGKYEFKANFVSSTPQSVPAPVYFEQLSSWILEQLDNPAVFPPPEHPYPKNFLEVIKLIFRRLFRVFVHLYYTHFDHARSRGEDAHMNTCFKHFVYFVQEFHLIDKRDLEPLADLIARLCSEPPLPGTGAARF